MYFLATDEVIEETNFSGIIDPSVEWHLLHHPGQTAELTYRIRVLCDVYHFNQTCTKFCKPRDDNFGHFICDRNGDKKCIDGWKGPNCDVGEPPFYLFMIFFFSFVSGFQSIGLLDLSTVYFHVFFVFFFF